MKRSSSMKNATSILPEERPSIYVLNSCSSQEEDSAPAPLPRTPEPLRKDSSTTTSSLFSPVSDISYSFAFLRDNQSPGIRLLSSSSDLEDRSDVEEECSRSQMATVDVRNDALSLRSSKSPFVESTGSLESLDGNESARSSGEQLASRASQPSLHFKFDDADDTPLVDLQRSRSMSDLSINQKSANDSSYHSLDRNRRSSQSSNSNNNNEKEEFVVLSALLYEQDISLQESSDSSEEETKTELEETQESRNEVPVIESPSIGSAARLLELPSISEENEEASRSRHPSMHGIDLDIPEPDHIAPGTFHKIEEEEMPPSDTRTIHRRVVSDTVTSYASSVPNEYAPVLDPLPYPVLIRDSIGRSSQSGRCMSQCILNSPEVAGGPITTDRSLSKSDPSLEEKIEDQPCGSDHPDSVDDEAPLIQAPEPPPVKLTRKYSVKPNSWQGYFSHGAATPHTVVTPATASLPHTSSKSKLSSKSENDKSRVEKPKQKNGSETFSLRGLFHGKKRPKLDGVNFSPTSEPGTPPGSATMPTSKSSSRSTLPNFSDSDGLTELPDRFQRLLSPSGCHEDEENGNVKVDYIQQLLENPLYAKFDLFSKPTHNSWREKWRPDKMNPKQVNKQDAIFELISLEREHCANLAFLQGAYRQRLMDEAVMTRDEVNHLIPDVIESLLLFHVHFLGLLLTRQAESNEIESISDILIAKLSEDGVYTSLCIDAYTTFGFSKDRSERHWARLIEKNQKFQDFIKRCNTHPLYRKYDFKTVMTRTISRPAKYGLLIDGILKHESNKFCPQYVLTEKAAETAKKFAMRIDNNLLILQMNKRWDEIKRNFDNSSQTRMFIADKSVPDGFISVEWNIESICSQMTQDKGRRLLCIGEAHVKSLSISRMTPVTVICFDDIIVFLSKKNGTSGKYQFAPMDQPVLSLHALILRNLAGNSLNMMLIPSVKPALVDIEFMTKTDLNKWQKTLEKAILHAPVKVRLNKRETDDYLRQATQEHEKLERKQKEAEEQWMKQLTEIFDRNSAEELAMFSNYVGKRNDFAQILQHHLDSMPLRGRHDLVEKVKDSVRQKFRELREMKTVPVKKLVSDMTQAKETILWNYLQELEEGTAVRLDSGDVSDGSGSDSSASGSRDQPRRVKTFHGEEGTSKPTKTGGIRRHTTVPRMGAKEEEHSDESDDVRRERVQAEERTHSLPLTQSLSCHRECRRLIRDLEKLKSENISLKNALALDKLRITSLEKMRTGSSQMLSSSVETLEVLRKKEKEVREDEARKKKYIEHMENDLDEQRKKFEDERAKFDLEKAKLESDHRRREAELAEKWIALSEARNGDVLEKKPRARVNTDYSAKSSQPQVVMTRDLSHLIEKTEVKKKK